MFAELKTKSNFKAISVSVFFYANVSAFAGNIQGYQFPVDCTTEKFAVTLGRVGGDSLSYILLLTDNFCSQMTKSAKITQSVKHSNTIRTPHSATTVSTLSFSEILSEVEKRFAVEKDCKNEAYAFILAMGLMKEFKAFSTQTKQVKDKHFLSLIAKL